MIQNSSRREKDETKHNPCVIRPSTFEMILLFLTKIFLGNFDTQSSFRIPMLLFSLTNDNQDIKTNPGISLLNKDYHSYIS